MAYRKRMFFSVQQKAEIWDRWPRGEPMSSIGRVFDRGSSSIYPLPERNGGTNHYRAARAFLHKSGTGDSLPFIPDEFNLQAQ